MGISVFNDIRIRKWDFSGGWLDPTENVLISKADDIVRNEDR